MPSAPGTTPDGPSRHHRMIRPIGFIRSCFQEKFAAPRQPGLCPDAWGELVFEPEFRNPDSLRGIEGFSHLWLIFGFHETIDQSWHPTVRPPRLGGNERVGVFASRSTFRPNSLGLSVVRLIAIRTDPTLGPILELGGIDIIDGTPIYDIKPYLPYAESLPDALAGFATRNMDVSPSSRPTSSDDNIPRLIIEIDPSATDAFTSLTNREQSVIRQALSLDPRPAASPSDPARIYGVRMCDKNIRFTIQDGICHITEIIPTPLV